MIVLGALPVLEVPGILMDRGSRRCGFPAAATGRT
jgi:hypothetical protein